MKNLCSGKEGSYKEFGKKEREFQWHISALLESVSSGWTGWLTELTITFMWRMF